LKYEFRWNAWNINHIAEHGVSPEEAEYVVRHPARSYPRHNRNHSKLVLGRTEEGVYLQVAYAVDPAPESTLFVFHARPLTEREKRRLISNRR